MKLSLSSPSPPASSLTLLFTFFPFHLLLQLLLPLLLLPRLLPLLLPRLLPLLLLPRPLPRLLPLLLRLLHLLLLPLPNPPFPLLVTTSCETHTVSGFSEPPHGTRLDTRLPVQGLAILAFPPLATSSAPSGLFQDQPSTTSERLGPQ